ncbi:DHS-like NAD/FAD-binding domain-containing protein [Sistotremastrum niveocremeum HHB9708]|uniref:NAD-dependent protein deacylase n=1 Tax=Sistotremastrum niveocremeum HHB9708 TaxID=1314777 RepID=A0A164S6E9_9AGAM|nr:DHS-like NAD/FAD-binding domain-containing protein [Sistotremastrum niveocremeum HHB9708]
MAPSRNIEEFRTLLRNSKRIVAVAGAGLSAASGLATFRGAGGLWRNYDAISLATPEAFEDDPSLVWQFYHMRREKVLQANPNPAHYALANLCIPNNLKHVAPNTQSFHLITQNVDGLSPRALQTILERSQMQDPDTIADAKHRVLEMHGRLLDTKCTQCGHREQNLDSPICAALGGTELVMERQEKEVAIPVEDLPRCSRCGGLARPGVVWFGETPWFLNEIDDIIEGADLGLIIGTSSTVYPAAGFASAIRERGGKVAVFNIENTKGDNRADFLFLGPCETVLPQVLFGDVPLEI